MSENRTVYDYDDLGDSPPLELEGSLRRKSRKRSKKLQEQGELLDPVQSSLRSIASSFWGQAWCLHLASYRDYEHRLPRGRSYLRNGSVIDLKINPGQIIGRVEGGYLYDVEIKISPMSGDRWKGLTSGVSRQITTLNDLLTGEISEEVISTLTHPETGVFPDAEEISFSCTCLDHANMCKHVAAVLYGVGVRLDRDPNLFFTLRSADQKDLIVGAGHQALSDAVEISESFDPQEMSDLFGIELDLDE